MSAQVVHEQGDLDPALLINTALPDACIAERAVDEPVDTLNDAVDNAETKEIHEAVDEAV